MLTIYWPNGMKKHSFDESIFDNLTGQEIIKYYPEIGDNGWYFICYPPLIKYTTGNLHEVKYFLINDIYPNSARRIKKAWHWMYCEAHGYIVIENYTTHSGKFKIVIGNSIEDKVKCMP